MKKISITWDSARAGYAISEPGWEGGEVYLAPDVQSHLLELERSHAATESTLRGELKREHAALMRASEMYRKCDNENDALAISLKEFSRKLDPSQWTEAEQEAWEKHMPNLKAAFDALRAI